MSRPTIQIQATSRQETGSPANRRLRNSGKLPGVVYAAGKEASNIQLDEHSFDLMLARHASESLVIDLHLDNGETKKVLLKEVQRHPISNRIVHVDFYELAFDRKVRIKISLVFQGTPVGVERDGGTLDIHLRSLEAECLPSDIIEQVVVDVSALELGSHVTSNDVQLDKSKYHLFVANDVSLATVLSGRVAEEAPAEGAAAAAPAAAAKAADTKSAKPAGKGK